MRHIFSFGAHRPIAGVTALLFLIGTRQHRTLWVLYLAALLLISRYCERQSAYVMVAWRYLGWRPARTCGSSPHPDLRRQVGELGVRAHAAAELLGTLPGGGYHQQARGARSGCAATA
jgi:hypothetical protein